MDIDGLLARQEGKTMEFKRDLSGRDGILRTITAFANSSGGTIVIGVTDSNRSVVGVQDPLDAEERLTNMIADTIEPGLIPDISLVAWRRLQLLIVDVHLSPLRPHHLRIGGRPPQCYVRLGSTNRVADAQFIEQLRREATGTTFDELPIPDLSRSDLDPDAIRAAFAPRRSLAERDLRTLRLLAEQQGRLVPTNAAMLLFGRNRTDRFPDAWIQAGRFAGTDRARILDSARLDQPLLDALEHAVVFIRRHTSTAIDIDGLRHHERPDYPIEAIREATINAVVHTDYSQRGAPIRVSMFDDRLEIENPGLLAFGLTIDDIRSGLSRIRNRVIARVFNELGLIEQWGSGIARMTNACRQSGMIDPEFAEIGGRFRVTLHRATGHKVIDDRDMAVLDALRNGPMRTSEIAHSVDRSIRWTRDRLKALTRQGLTVEIGEGPNDPHRRYARP